MDRKDIAIIVLSVLLLVTISVLAYLIATRGQMEMMTPYLPNEIARSNIRFHEYPEVIKMQARHTKEINDAQEKLKRIRTKKTTLWDNLMSPFAETVDEIGSRHVAESNQLYSKLTDHRLQLMKRRLNE